MTKIFNLKPAILIFFIFLLPIVIYHFVFDYFFFQDDFFEINISKASNLGQYLSFYKFRSDIIAYRPISLQNYFFVSSSLFDLNPIGFRLIILILFLLTGFLIQKTVFLIVKNQAVSLLTTFFWLTSSIHFMALAWIAAAYNIIGTFFFLLTSFFFLKFAQSEKLIFYYACLLLFLVTIGSFEFSMSFPAIFGLYYFWVKEKRLVATLKIISPFLLLLVIYLVLRLMLIKIPQIPEYHVTFNSQSIKALAWYLLWTFNIPEEFKKQVVGNLIFFNPFFLAEFWPLVFLSFTGFFWMITLTIFAPFYKTIRTKLYLDKKILSYLTFWFLAAISPVLLLPNHTFTMYLTLASIGIYALISFLLAKSQEKILIFLAGLIWIITSFSTLKFYKVNSWIGEAQKTAKIVTSDLRRQLPTLPSNSIVYYYLQSPRHWQALSYQEAVKTIYNDPTLSIYYNKQELINEVQKTKINRPIYIYTPE